MKVYSFLTLAQDRSECTALCTGHLTAVQSSLYSQNRRLTGFQSQSGYFGEQKNFIFVPGIKPWYLGQPPYNTVILPIIQSLYSLHVPGCLISKVRVWCYRHLPPKPAQLCTLVPIAWGCSQIQCPAPKRFLHQSPHLLLPHQQHPLLQCQALGSSHLNHPLTKKLSALRPHLL